MLDIGVRRILCAVVLSLSTLTCLPCAKHATPPQRHHIYVPEAGLATLELVVDATMSPKQRREIVAGADAWNLALAGRLSIHVQYAARNRLTQRKPMLGGDNEAHFVSVDDRNDPVSPENFDQWVGLDFPYGAFHVLILQAEWLTAHGHLTRVTMHELGHVLGLPDIHGPSMEGKTVMMWRVDKMADKPTEWDVQELLALWSHWGGR